MDQRAESKWRKTQLAAFVVPAVTSHLHEPYSTLCQE